MGSGAAVVVGTAHARGAGDDIVVALVEGHRRGSHRVVVVGFSVALADTEVASSVGQLASVTVAHGRADVVAVAIIVGVVRVTVVVVVVDGLVAVMVRVIPRITACAGIVRAVPTPAIAETVIIPVG